jgi:hypothetical protein
MTLTSRDNEIMIETNKGLYFAKIYIEENDFHLVIDEEVFFKNEWVKSAVETDPDTLLVYCLGDNNLHVIDRNLNLVIR